MFQVSKIATTGCQFPSVSLPSRSYSLISAPPFQEGNFLTKLNESHETSLRRLSDTHREKIALLDRQFLQQKQQLMRAREAATWEMEERQLHEKHQLAKRQLKDMFFLQRHQMLVSEWIMTSFSDPA